MPTISMFYGIVIRMYFGESEHPPPHFHAEYAGDSMKVEIKTGKIIAGSLPPRQTRLVLAWTDLRREELMANWEILRRNEEPFRIEPL